MAVFAEHIAYKRQWETHHSRSVKESLGEGGPRRQELWNNRQLARRQHDKDAKGTTWRTQWCVQGESHDEHVTNWTLSETTTDRFPTNCLLPLARDFRKGSASIDRSSLGPCSLTLTISVFCIQTSTILSN